MSTPHEHISDVTGEMAGDETDPAAPLLIPAAEVRAIVRFDDPPLEPPDDLLAVVMPEHDDWVLTEDSLAFGDPDVIERFAAWRSSWERTWILDQRASIRRLLDLDKATGTEQASELAALVRQLADANGSDDMLIPPDLLSRVRGELGRLARLVRSRNELGHGIIDLTPNTRRTGLARAWPAWGDAEVLSAAYGTEVVLEPGDGLYVRLDDDRSDGFGPIELTTSDVRGWTIHAGDRQLRLDHERARPIAWLIPGSISWRHRRVPEIITCARTLSGLDECLEFAGQQGLPVHITTRRPIQRT